MAGKSGKRKIEQYRHADKQRPNNPPVGLVTPETDQETTRRTYAYDPHKHWSFTPKALYLKARGRAAHPGVANL